MAARPVPPARASVSTATTIRRPVRATAREAPRVAVRVMVRPTAVRPTRMSSPDSRLMRLPIQAHHASTAANQATAGHTAGRTPVGPKAMPRAPRSMMGAVPSMGRRARTVSRPAAREHRSPDIQGMTAGPT